MCLSKAYKREKDGALTFIMGNVSNVRVDGERVILSDILGAETPILGSLAYCDLVNGKLEISAIGG